MPVFRNPVAIGGHLRWKQGTRTVVGVAYTRLDGRSTSSRDPTKSRRRLVDPLRCDARGINTLRGKNLGTQFAHSVPGQCQASCGKR
jgi:hypothetical protein